jgi:hypothetical protein
MVFKLTWGGAGAMPKGAAAGKRGVEIAHGPG